MLNKVPEITVYFWLIKVLCTTVGDAEIILETPPAHLSHWLHVDLPRRIAELGYPTETIAAAGAVG